MLYLSFIVIGMFSVLFIRGLIEIITGADHVSSMERPAQFNKIVKEFARQ